MIQFVTLLLATLRYPPRSVIDLRALSSDVDILSFTRILPIRQLQAHAVTDDITN